MSDSATLPITGRTAIEPVTATPITRRLTAILLADVVGYSGMMSRDEDGTHARVAREVRELTDLNIKKYGGRFVRSMGDGTLVEFGSALDAVRCGLDIQRGLAERQADGSDRVRLRIGINTGDVLADDRDIYGNSVNIAARLQTLSTPGTVYVSHSIYDQTRSHPDLFFVDRGQHRVKNISYMIHVFEVAYEPIQTPILARLLRRRVGLAAMVIVAAVLAAPVTTMVVDRNHEVVARTNKIIVLPFRNVGGDSADDYLADAITDDLTTELSRLRHAWVMASATAFTYKAKRTDPRQIGRDLNVRYVLEGTVKRVGSIVYVNAQLIDTETGTNLWGDRFSHQTSSLLDLEDTMTRRFATTLNDKVIKASVRHEVGTLAGDGNPLDRRMRAMAADVAYPTQEKSAETRRQAEEGLLADPDNARLLALLAAVLISDVFNSWNLPDPAQVAAQVDRAEQLTKKAISLDYNTARAHYALGFVYRVRNNHSAALASFMEAFKIDSSMARALVQAANEKVFLGDPSGAIPLATHALQLSPSDRSIGVFYWVLGRAYFTMGNEYPNAIEWLQRSVNVRPNLWFVWVWLSAAHALNGNKDGAKDVRDEFMKRFEGWNLERIIGVYSKEQYQNPTLEAAKTELINGLRIAEFP